MTWFAGSCLVAAVAFLIDRLIGYPDWLYRIIKHPVVWIGVLLSWLDGRLNDPTKDFSTRRRNGCLALFVVLAAVVLVAAPVVMICRLYPGGVLIEGALAACFLAWSSLHDHVSRVACALENGVDAGREAVSHIVGRDPTGLDEEGVAVAAVESLAENYSDGVIAPLFWLLIGGLPGIAVYKAINTADSMIGYRSERHLAFGWASARLDDLVNLPGSRISALLLVIAGLFQRDAKPKGGWRAAMRDAGSHVSPNAGWPESALAGTLGISLGGVRSYAGRDVELAVMGDGPRPAGADDIRAALRLCEVATDIALAVLLTAALAVVI